jgi:hypothetical protein
MKEVDDIFIQLLGEQGLDIWGVQWSFGACVVTDEDFLPVMSSQWWSCGRGVVFSLRL